MLLPTEKGSIRVKAICFHGENSVRDAIMSSLGWPGVVPDGMVLYQVTTPISPDDKRPEAVTITQPFRKGESAKTGEGSSERNVWGWNGNRDAPTLTPSFTWPRDPEKYPWLAKVHHHFTQGKIVPCGDAEVAVEPMGDRDP